MILHRAYLAGAVSIIGGAFFSGCVQVGPKQMGPAAVHNQIAENRAIPPIPTVVHISIEPGTPVQADAGGEALLREYAKAREDCR